MKIKETEISDCFTFDNNVYSDNRGYFHVPYQKNLVDLNITLPEFVQENESYSNYGTIRGIHFQQGESSQSKLIRCSYGKVLDVVIDLRYNSPTYGKVLTFLLDEPNKMVFIPKGCGHGFSVLSEFAIFNYKVDEYYDPDSEGGIVYNDKKLNIDWMVPPSKQIVSEKDLLLPPFSL